MRDGESGAALQKPLDILSVCVDTKQPWGVPQCLPFGYVTLWPPEMTPGVMSYCGISGHDIAITQLNLVILSVCLSILPGLLVYASFTKVILVSRLGC